MHDFLITRKLADYLRILRRFRRCKDEAVFAATAPGGLARGPLTILRALGSCTCRRYREREALEWYLTDSSVTTEGRRDGDDLGNSHTEG